MQKLAVTGVPALGRMASLIIGINWPALLTWCAVIALCCAFWSRVLATI